MMIIGVAAAVADDAGAAVCVCVGHRCSEREPVRAILSPCFPLSRSPRCVCEYAHCGAQYSAASRTMELSGKNRHTDEYEWLARKEEEEKEARSVRRRRRRINVSPLAQQADIFSRLTSSCWLDSVEFVALACLPKQEFFDNDLEKCDGIYCATQHSISRPPSIGLSGSPIDYLACRPSVATLSDYLDRRLASLCETPLRRMVAAPAADHQLTWRRPQRPTSG